MIRGPKKAIPTPKGWVHPRTNELLKSQRISQKQIDEWYGVSEPAPEIELVVEKVIEEEPEPEQEVVDFESMTKSELISYAAEAGVELPLLVTKKKIIDILNQ